MSTPSLADIEQTLTTAIGQQETGNGAAGVGATLLNAGAIKFANWETEFGATPTASGFAQFPTLAQSQAALTQLIDNYIQNGASIQSLINKYAPASDGNTNNASRVLQLQGLTGLDPTAPILGQTSGAPASGTPSTSTPGTLQNLGSAASAAVGSAAVNAATAAMGNVFKTSWLNPSRIAAVVVGLILFVLGLSMLKSTQPIVEVISSAAGKAKDAAFAGAAAA